MYYGKGPTNDLNMIVREISYDIQRATEDGILEQLNDFISRGLITIEITTPQLIQDYGSTKIRVSQSVKVLLKDKEYIETLEKENKELKDLLTRMNDLVSKRGMS